MVLVEEVELYNIDDGLVIGVDNLVEHLDGLIMEKRIAQ